MNGQDHRTITEVWISKEGNKITSLTGFLAYNNYTI